MTHGPRNKWLLGCDGKDYILSSEGGMMTKICPNCKGNGFRVFRWEAESITEQCKVCHSQGELKENKHYHQSWDETAHLGNINRTLYFGPPLDPESFSRYKIESD